MNYKKLLCALICVVLCFACVACNLIPKVPDSDGDNSDFSDGEIADENDVEIVEPDTTAHDFVLVSQVDGTYNYKCAECNEEESVVITYISGTANAYTVEENTITFNSITQKSVYDISGRFHGNIVVDVSDDYKFELQMSGFEMYSYTECPITILSGDKVTLSAKKETKNYIYDIRAAVDSTDENSISASVYAKCDLDIQGKGSLNIKSLNNNGIHTKDDLNVKNLSLQVDCKDNALKGNDSVSIESGDLILIARQGDGIKTTNSDVSSKGNQRGSVTISGGNVLIYSACDGIDAAYDMNIDESTATVNLQIFTDKYSKFSEKVATVNNNSNTNALHTMGNGLYYGWTNQGNSGPVGRPGEMGGVPGGMGGGPSGEPGGMSEGNSDKGNYSTKGIKADNSITISAGEVTISSYDDSIHANSDGVLENGETPLGKVTVTGGSLTLRSNDDAIHADGKVSISGGSIKVVSSYEGIEGNTVEIIDGDVSVIASDDGINGTATSGTSITISGGKIYVYAGGDGVDSNSTTSYEGIIFSGGTSVIISTGQSDSSIDTERGYKYTGGFVVGISQRGGMGSEATNCSNFSSIGTKKTLSIQKDEYLVVDGSAIVKMPVSINALVVCLGKTSASISTSASAK